MLQNLEETQIGLLRRIAAQDRDALAEFYDQTAKPLFSLAFRLLNNTAEAEEVIQDVFMLIWTKAGKFDEGRGQAFHWALSLTRNRCIDRLRSRQRRSRVIVNVESDEEWRRCSESALIEPTLQEHDVQVIQSAVQALPMDQRQAIELAFFGGLSHPEIAESLNEPLGTIKARIRRGMLKLRDSLEAFI